MARECRVDSVPEEEFVRSPAEGVHSRVQNDARVRGVRQPEVRRPSDDIIQESEHVQARDVRSADALHALQDQVQSAVELSGEESSRALRGWTEKTNERRQSDVRGVCYQEVACAGRVQGKKVVTDRKKSRLDDGGARRAARVHRKFLQ